MRLVLSAYAFQFQNLSEVGVRLVADMYEVGLNETLRGARSNLNGLEERIDLGHDLIYPLDVSERKLAYYRANTEDMAYAAGAAVGASEPRVGNSSNPFFRTYRSSNIFPRLASRKHRRVLFTYLFCAHFRHWSTLHNVVDIAIDKSLDKIITESSGVLLFVQHL